jgi:DNA invertase Pin-like site-specific DNA recombinase
MRVLAYRYGEAGGGTSPHPSWGEAAHHYDIAKYYEDLGLPLRPQLTQLLADNHHHPADLILVQGLESLGDSLAEVVTQLQALAAMGSRVMIWPSGVPVEDLTLLPQLAEVQDQLRRRQLRRGHARNRLRSLPPPGKAPYGYRRGQDRYLIDRATAPVVTAFVNEFLLYGSLRGAVRFIEGRFGKRIAVSTGRRWLTHPVYRGDLQYQDGHIQRGTHAAIIGRPEAAQIDRLLRRNSQLPPRTAGAPRSLAGLVSCQTCGSPFIISQTSRRGQAKTYLYLRPRHCGGSPRCGSLSYDTALKKIIDQICQDLPQAVTRLQSPGASHAVPGVAMAVAPGMGPESGHNPSPAPAGIDPRGPQRAHQSSTLASQIAEKEGILGQLPGLVEAGILDPETADLRRYTLEGEIAQLEQQRSQLPPVNLQELSRSVAIPQFWLDLSEAERRFFFREFIRRIQIQRRAEDWQVHLELVF